MELNIKKAFLSPFSEKQWYIKWIFPIIVSACFLVFNPNLNFSNTVKLLIIFVCIIPYLILWGFLNQFQHNEIHDETPILPILSGKVKNYFIYGTRLCVITLVYLIFCFVLFLIALFTLELGLIIKILTILSLFGAVIYLWIALIFAQSSYADNFCFRDAMNFKKVFKLMSKVKIEIFIWFLIVALLGFILKLVLMLPLFILIIYPIVRVLVKLILNNLSAQLYKIAKFRLENTD